MNDVESLENGEMLWRDGWTFKRQADGSVRLRKLSLDQDGKFYVATIPAREWVSIIQHVGAEQTAEAFKLAWELHKGAR